MLGLSLSPLKKTTQQFFAVQNGNFQEAPTFSARTTPAVWKGPYCINNNATTTGGGGVDVKEFERC